MEHQVVGCLPEPTGTSCFESSNIFMDWIKFIPFSSAGAFLSSLQWPETTSGMVQRLPVLRQPKPNLARWTGQIVISDKFAGFWKHPHLAKINSTSVSIPENFNDFLWILVSLLHRGRGVTEVEELVRSSAPRVPPAVFGSEQDIAVLWSSPTVNSGFRCNVSQIKIIGFIYLKNDAIFVRTGTSDWLSKA